MAMRDDQCLSGTLIPRCDWPNSRKDLFQYDGHSVNDNPRGRCMLDSIVNVPREMTVLGPQFTARRLAWRDISLGVIAFANGHRMRLTLGLGSGLSQRAGDPKGTIWAIADRGPNLKIKPAIERYGLVHLKPLSKVDGAKIMPRPQIGPTICQLKLDGDTVRLVRQLPLRGVSGRPISGLPIPIGTADVEPAFDISGVALGSDPSGADTEAIVALSDGTFWIGDEYGPSLLHVDRNGQVLQRWVPKGLETALKGADYDIKPVLPAIALRRRINRGFEAVAVSRDERWLYLVFQSPLAHPGVTAFDNAQHVRIWKLDARTGAMAAQYLYPLDAPATFRRDQAAGHAARSDVKVSEIAVFGRNRLLVLERISRTTKLYQVDLSPRFAVPVAHMDVRTRPTIEQLSAASMTLEDVPVLAKSLVLTTDDAPDMDRDLEGLVVLSPNELLLVTDNDFSVEGARTRFWRVRLAVPLA
jgi:Esterase-like activity of phytase